VVYLPYPSKEKISSGNPVSPDIKGGTPSDGRRSLTEAMRIHGKLGKPDKGVSRDQSHRRRFLEKREKSSAMKKNLIRHQGQGGKRKHPDKKNAGGGKKPTEGFLKKGFWGRGSDRKNEPKERYGNTLKNQGETKKYVNDVENQGKSLPRPNRLKA